MSEDTLFLILLIDTLELYIKSNRNYDFIPKYFKIITQNTFPIDLTEPIIRTLKEEELNTFSCNSIPALKTFLSAVYEGYQVSPNMDFVKFVSSQWAICDKNKLSEKYNFLVKSGSIENYYNYKSIYQVLNNLDKIDITNENIK